MSTITAKLTDVQARLEALATQHSVPGASLAILSGDELLDFTAGVANVDTGLPVTSKTHFQIGSNTKVYTATLAMRLVDQGKVDLDEPVSTYLPSFKLKGKAWQRITLRHLLTHTNGIDGADYFDDFGQNDDGLERFVASLTALGQIHPPGQMWSYCNTGFCVAGRVVEEVTGSPFRRAFHETLLEPLGLQETTVRVEDMLVRSCAVGHVTSPDSGEPVVTPTALLPSCHAPAGALTAATSKDLLRFVKMHLSGGRAAGKRFLKRASVEAMQQPQVERPRSSMGGAMGLGWVLSDWDGERVVGHGGGTVGQLSFLQVLPDRPFAVALLTNSRGGSALWRDLGGWVFSELAGVRMPQIPKAPDEPPDTDLRRYTGVYRRRDIDTEIVLADGELVAKVSYTGPVVGIDTTQEIPLRPVDEALFQTNDGQGLAEFLGSGRDGRPRYLHFGGRASRRTSARGRKKA